MSQVSKVEQVLVPNVTISRCKFRKPYMSSYGLQFGCIISGEGLDKLGLKPTPDGDGYWYSTKAEYDGVPVDVKSDFITNMEGEDIPAELADGSTAHVLFNVKPHPAGVRKDGTKYKAGVHAKIIAVRAVDYEIKGTAQDALSAALLEANITDSAPF